MKVYQYGLLPPTVNADLVRQQIRSAHVYRNTLVEIERGRRAAERAVLSAPANVAAAEVEVAAANAALDAARQVVKRERGETRSRSETTEQREAILTARERRKAARATLGDLRREARVAAVDIRKEIEGRANDLRKSAREHCQTYWGTYLLIEDAADQSRKTTPLYDGEAPNDPRFVRWSGEGRVGVQIQAQKGKPPFLSERVFGANTLLCIDPVDERAWLQETPRGERRRLSRTILRMRVGSDEKGRPLWAEWPMVMHRALPAGVVKCATVSLRKVGPREQWTVEITVDEAPSRPRCGTGTVAVHLGWLDVDDGIRAATWMDEGGDSGEVVLGDAQLVTVDGGKQWQTPSGATLEHMSMAGAVLSGIERASTLRSTRDKAFNEARDALLAWLHAHNVPEWMRVATSHLHAWRAAGRLAALALRWRKQRWDGDSDAYNALEAWRFHDHHLWRWEANQRTGALRRRREVYRQFAADLARRYGTLVLDDTKLNKIAKKKATEEPGEGTAPRANRHESGVSELRMCLTNAFKSRGGEVRIEESAGISITCPECGEAHEFHRDVVRHRTTCMSCTYTWDLDKTALVNMMASAGIDVSMVLARKKQADAAVRAAAA